MQAFLGEAARRRQSRRSSTSSKGTSGPSAVFGDKGSHQRTKSSSSARLFQSKTRTTKRDVQKRASTRSLTSDQPCPPSSSHNDRPSDKETVDVFAFMEHDEEDKASSTAIDEEEEVEEDNDGDENHDNHSQLPLPSSAAVPDIIHDAPERHLSVGYSDLEVHAAADEDHDHHDRQSSQSSWLSDRARSDTFHSDSGISMHSCSNSSGGDSPIIRQKVLSRSPLSDGHSNITSMPRLCIGTDTFPFRDQPSRRASAARLRRLPAVSSQSQELYGKCPESYYGPATDTSMIPEIETHSPQSLSSAKVKDLPQVSSSFSSPIRHTFGESVEMPSPLPPTKKHSPSSSTKASSPHTTCPSYRKKDASSGYSFLASSISTQHPSSDAVLRPIYRKFETLNNRILLYLQDEICEMEQDLKDLDEAITVEEKERRSAMGLPTHPGVGLANTKSSKVGGRSLRRESRRQEAKFPSQLQWVRQELMGRLGGKVAQYSMLLHFPFIIRFTYYFRAVYRMLTIFLVKIELYPPTPISPNRSIPPQFKTSRAISNGSPSTPRSPTKKPLSSITTPISPLWFLIITTTTLPLLLLPPPHGHLSPPRLPSPTTTRTTPPSSPHFTTITTPPSPQSSPSSQASSSSNSSRRSLPASSSLSSQHCPGIVPCR